MKIRTSITIGLAILLGTVMSILAISTFKGSEKNNFVQQEIPIVVNQLTLPNGAMVVKLECAKVFINQPDTLNTFSCVLINNTNKNILASSIKYAIVVDHLGKEEKDERLLITDSFIHPDVVETIKPVGLGGFIRIQPPGQITMPETTIKRLEIKIDYIEFSDKTILGSYGKGAEKIANIREGALNYKKWLKQVYMRGGKQEREVIPLLAENYPISNEVMILNSDQELGARSYKRRVQELFKRHGSKYLSNILNQ